MFSGWVRGWRLRKAARDYALRLGPQLLRDYGAGAAFAAAQIRTSAARAGLRLDFIALGYAAFMDEAGFLATGVDEGGLGYAGLRGLIRKYVAGSVSAGFMPLGENSDAFAGASLSVRDPGG